VEAYADGHVVLAPQAWLGHPLPIASAITGVPDLGADNWVVVFARSGCDDCERLAREIRRRPLVRARIAWIEVPNETPTGSAEGEHASPGTVGRLDSRYKWVVHTPSAVIVSGGVVRAASGDVGEIVRWAESGQW
jgi:hypothetical protein